MATKTVVRKSTDLNVGDGQVRLIFTTEFLAEALVLLGVLLVSRPELHMVARWSNVMDEQTALTADEALPKWQVSCSKGLPKAAPGLLVA
jgi:hypothetical protein